jgi:hypothetical protein
MLPYLVLKFLQTGLVSLAIWTANEVTLINSIGRFEAANQLLDYLFEHTYLVCALGCILSHGQSDLFFLKHLADFIEGDTNLKLEFLLISP